MIEVKGQYFLQFAISDFRQYDDFIGEGDLISFTLIEEVGNVLPTFELNFKTADERVYPLLHDGNDLKVTLSSSAEADKINTTLTITRLNSYKSGVHKRVISIKGLLNKIAYMNNSKVEISDSKDSVSYILEKARLHFKEVDSNVKKSNDIQKWIQPNKSDRKAITDAWLHSYINDQSFLAIGITSEGIFRLKDIYTEVKKDSYDWKFTPYPKSSKDIMYLGDPFVETNSGFINSWLGYERELHIYDLETSEEEEISQEVSPLTSLSKEVAKRIEVSKKYGSVCIQNENCHTNYWKAHQANLLKLVNLGNVKVTISFNHTLDKVKVLDKVYFEDYDTSEGGLQASEFFSGVYIVAKVGRTITDRQFTTTVVLCREGLNRTKNTV